MGSATSASLRGGVSNEDDITQSGCEGVLAASSEQRIMDGGGGGQTQYLIQISQIEQKISNSADHHHRVWHYLMPRRLRMLNGGGSG